MDVNAYLDRNGLTIQHLAELTGYNPSSIHHWIAGTREMSTAAEKHLQLLEVYMREHGEFPVRNVRNHAEKRWINYRKKTKNE